MEWSGEPRYTATRPHDLECYKTVQALGIKPVIPPSIFLQVKHQIAKVMSAPRNSNAKDLEAFEPKDKGIAHTDHARAVLSASRTDSSMSEAPYAEHGVLIDRSPTVDLKKKAGLGLFWPKFRLVLRGRDIKALFELLFSANR